MPKPKGTCGATKMKIMAVISHNCDKGKDSYGYEIWQQLKDNFFVYMDDNDIRNVYHHLNDLCNLGYIAKTGDSDECPKCYYTITDMGQKIRHRFDHFIEILNYNTEQVLTLARMRGLE
jgi:DNA-binding PadR family transcriptional regulator